MNIANNDANDSCMNAGKSFNVRFTEAMLYDRLNILSADYSISSELVNFVAVKRLFDDVDLVRGLRIGKSEPE